MGNYIADLIKTSNVSINEMSDFFKAVVQLNKSPKRNMSNVNLNHNRSIHELPLNQELTFEKVDTDSDQLRVSINSRFIGHIPLRNKEAFIKDATEICQRQQTKLSEAVQKHVTG